MPRLNVPPWKTVLLTALLAATALGADPEGKPIPSILADPSLKQGLTKVVSAIRKSDDCLESFAKCRNQCGFSPDNSGCFMECQTDCSVCVLEKTGRVDNEVCDHRD